MLSIEGLNDDIQSLMLSHERARVLNKILDAAKEGRTEVKVQSKALTPGFIMELENELVFATKQDDGSYLLFWEF